MAHSSRVKFVVVGSHGGSCVKQLVTLCSLAGGRERGAGIQLASFLLSSPGA